MKVVPNRHEEEELFAFRTARFAKDAVLKVVPNRHKKEEPVFRIME